jgi:oligo-alginate lyase
MKKNIIWILLLLFTACGKAPSTKIIEDKLAASVDKYIKQHNLEASKDADVNQLNTSLARPVIAVTEAEMSRLKAAWASQGTEHDVLAWRFAKADEAIAAGLTFPPEGGQHNQWYQCDSCQRGLLTIDAHHHQCPICRRIYSGFPYDNVLYNRQHSQNLKSAEDAAWAWAVTGDKKYADFSTAVLIGYAERYLNYPMVHAAVNDKTIDVAAGKLGKYKTAGHILEQTLDEAMAMIPAATAYDLIYNTLSEQQKLQIEKKFLRAMAECINVHKAGKSNWQTWHNAALLYAGAVMGDSEMLKQSLLDDKNGFTAQMKISVLPEGMWYENSWGYHYYTLTAMTHIAEGARRLGFDVYSFAPLRKMYLLAFDYMMPDGSLPRFGDAVQDSPRQGVNEKAYAVYKDDRLLSVLSSGPTWDGIVLGRDMSKKTGNRQSASKLIPGAGHAVLATNGPAKLTAAISFGPYGGFHGHFDKLSFVLFGYGEELGVDPGRSASQAYRLPIHTQWYKASTGHNVVLVDGMSQQEADGKYLAYKAAESYAAVVADAGPAFRNVSHQRFLLLSPDYLLVIDELKSNDGIEHTFDWLYHNKGHYATCNLPSDFKELGNKPEGYSYVNEISGYKSERNQLINAKFVGSSVNLCMTMSGNTGDEVFTGNGPFTSVEDRVPMIIVRRKGKTVRFVALLEPLVLNGKPVVKTLNLSGDPSSFTATVSHDGGEDLISFQGNKLEEFVIKQKTISGEQVVLKN